LPLRFSASALLRSTLAACSRLAYSGGGAARLLALLAAPAAAAAAAAAGWRRKLRGEIPNWRLQPEEARLAPAETARLAGWRRQTEGGLNFFYLALSLPKLAKRSFCPAT